MITLGMLFCLLLWAESIVRSAQNKGWSASAEPVRFLTVDRERRVWAVIQANDYIDVIQWIDGDQFLFLTREPRRLLLASLDGTTVPIVAWPLDEWVTPQSFSAVVLQPPG
jgi:hypothetical protein